MNLKLIRIVITAYSAAIKALITIVCTVMFFLNHNNTFESFFLLDSIKKAPLLSFTSGKSLGKDTRVDCYYSIFLYIFNV